MGGGRFVAYILKKKKVWCNIIYGVGLSLDMSHVTNDFFFLMFLESLPHFGQNNFIYFFILKWREKRVIREETNKEKNPS